MCVLRTPETNNRADEGEELIEELILETFIELGKALAYAY